MTTCSIYLYGLLTMSFPQTRSSWTSKTSWHPSWMVCLYNARESCTKYRNVSYQHKHKKLRNDANNENGATPGKRIFHETKLRAHYLHGEVDELHELCQFGDLINLPYRFIQVEPSFSRFTEARPDRWTQCTQPTVFQKKLHLKRKKRTLFSEPNNVHSLILTQFY
jgi:hypothetical protein